MTNHEKFKQAFSGVTAPPEVIANVMEITSGKPGTIRRFPKKILSAALAACLVFAIGAAGYCVASGRIIKGWGKNADYEICEDEGLQVITTLHTEDLSEPVSYRDGKMYFTANGEELDITADVTTEKAYSYVYQDEEGILHTIVIGLNTEEPGNYGFAEFISDGKDWLGGYSARCNQEADGSGPAWLENAKDELNIPW